MYISVVLTRRTDEASDLVDDVSMMFDNHNMQLEEVFSDEHELSFHDLSLNYDNTGRTSLGRSKPL